MPIEQYAKSKKGRKRLIKGYSGGSKKRSAPSPSSKRLLAGSRSAPTRSSVSAPKPAPSPSPSPSPRQRLASARKAMRRGQATLPGLDAESTANAAKVLSTGLKKGATKKELVSAAATGLVESNFKNVPEAQSDRDSAGWRQERGSIYGRGKRGHLNVKAGARRYFKETAAAGRGKGTTAGTLSQAVQRSAFPERYDERKGEARKIVRGYLKGKKKVASGLKGPWGGSRRAIKQIIGKQNLRENTTSTKRSDTVGGASSTGSDHHVSQKSAFAADLPNEQKYLDRINKKLGINAKLNQGTYTTSYKGYRVQLITEPHGTGPHIHIGAKLEDSPTPSSSSYASSGGTGTAATGGTPSAGVGAQSRVTARAGRRQPSVNKRRELLDEILAAPRAFSTPQVGEKKKTVKKADPKKVKLVSLGLR